MTPRTRFTLLHRAVAGLSAAFAAILPGYPTCAAAPGLTTQGMPSLSFWAVSAVALLIGFAAGWHLAKGRRATADQPALADARPVDLPSAPPEAAVPPVSPAVWPGACCVILAPDGVLRDAATGVPLIPRHPASGDEVSRDELAAWSGDGRAHAVDLSRGDAAECVALWLLAAEAGGARGLLLAGAVAPAPQPIAAAAPSAPPPDPDPNLLADLDEAMAALAAGDLTVSLASGPAQARSTLAPRFEAVVGRLRETIRAAMAQCQSLGGGVGEIAAMATQLTDRAQAQRAALDHGRTTLTTLAEGVSDVSASAQEADHVAAEAVARAQLRGGGARRGRGHGADFGIVRQDRPYRVGH